MKSIRNLLFVIPAILVLAACSKVTEANFEKIHNGMTTDEVKAVMGPPTNVQSSSLLGVVSGTTYTYTSGSSSAKISFVNDKVVSTEGDFK